jgi:peroxiredoxin
VIAIITLAFTPCNHPVETDLIASKKGTTLSTFNLLLPDSSTIHHTSQIKGKPICVFFFEPNCQYRQQQIEEIKANMPELEDVQFVLLTGEGFKGMRNFAEMNTYPS